MASQVPPVKGSAYSFEVSLVSQGDTDIFQTSVTLAAGDVIVYQDGVLDGNIDTLPTEIGTSGVLVVALSASEMTADRVTVRFHDAAGDEWQDLLVSLHTAAQTHDTTDAAVDANGTAISGLNDLDAAGIRTAVGLGSANLDTQLSTIDGVVDAVLLDTGTDGVVLADDAITSDKFDESTAFPQTTEDVGAMQL